MRPSKSGMIVSANPLATKAGVAILKQGGNAVDAAVTVAHVLGVAAAPFSGIGGGGFALIWLAREEKTVFIDFREKAPSAVQPNLFELTPSGRVKDRENAEGYRAVAVPGAVAGHASLLEKYGTMSLKQTLDPAAKIARRGFRVGRALAYSWRVGAKKLKRFRESRATYLKKGRPFSEGQVVTLPSLARSIEIIGKKGPDEFYKGNIAQKIVLDMEANKGLLTMDDLATYEPTFRQPLRGTYKQYEVITAPPPSSGGAIILQSLNILEELPQEDLGTKSPHSLHMLAETLSRSFVSCRSTISDPAFSITPTEKLLSKAYAQELASSISPSSASLIASHSSPLMPDSNTSHFVAIDAEHNVVSFTESVECYFGSGVTVPSTGIILNDTMHDFDPQPQTVNSVAPGKIPMSSMSPTIVLKDGRPILALGAAGGPRIASATFQVLLNVIGGGMSLFEAVASPRIHIHNSRIQTESPMVRGTPGRLRRMGHLVEVKRCGKYDPGMYFGGVQAAQILEDTSLLGVPDPRRDGLALGL